MATCPSERGRMKKYEFSSSLSGVAEVIEADAFHCENGTISFCVFDDKGVMDIFAVYLVGPGSFVREIKEPKDA